MRETVRYSQNWRLESDMLLDARIALEVGLSWLINWYIPEYQTGRLKLDDQS